MKARTREQVLEELVNGLDHLLACYRMSKTPAGSLLDRIRELRLELRSLERIPE